MYLSETWGKFIPFFFSLIFAFVLGVEFQSKHALDMKQVLAIAGLFLAVAFIVHYIFCVLDLSEMLSKKDTEANRE